MADRTLYSYNDVVLIPQYSELRTRQEADTSASLWKCKLKHPIISANMETITGASMATAMWREGGLGALHRFWSVEENTDAYKAVRASIADCIVSIGANDKNRFQALYQNGARMFCVDIAHGHSILMKETLSWIRGTFGHEPYLIAGNVATPEAVEALAIWGADAVKIGIGQGAICTTRLVTGHGVPSFSSLLDCGKVADACGIKMIADGGMRCSGDIVKSLVCGADLVMLGNLLAGTSETPGEILIRGVDEYKIYKGSASYDRKGVTKEGVVAKVPFKGPVQDIIQSLIGGLRSGMSYCNAKTISEIPLKAKWSVQTNNGFKEGLPHVYENNLGI